MSSESDIRPIIVEKNWGKVALPGLGAGTVALVTGGTGAICMQVARVLLCWGANVAITSRSQARVDEVVAELGGGGRLLGIAADVGKEIDGKRAVSAVVEKWGRLDVLIQGAAVGGHSPLNDVDESQIDAMFGSNVKGVILTAKAAAVQMRAQRRGKIVNISSIVAHRAPATRLVYGATKAAVNHITRYLATELGPYGITVNSVSPGQTPTNLTKYNQEPGAKPVPADKDIFAGGAKTPLRRRGLLDDYIGPILFLSSDLADYVTGTDIVVDGGLILSFP
jgi:gluconate 5-dehydrogenase